MVCAILIGNRVELACRPSRAGCAPPARPAEGNRSRLFRRFLLSSADFSRSQAPRFDLTQGAETASCRACVALISSTCQNDMRGSVVDIIWAVSYLSVLIGLSAYGIHRYCIIYLFLK